MSGRTSLHTYSKDMTLAYLSMPVSALQAYFKNFSFTPHTPAFLVQDNSIICSLTADELHSGIKSLFSLLQLDPYSTHSLRRRRYFRFFVRPFIITHQTPRRLALTGIRSLPLTTLNPQKPKVFSETLVPKGGHFDPPTNLKR